MIVPSKDNVNSFHHELLIPKFCVRPIKNHHRMYLNLPQYNKNVYKKYTF